MQIIPGLSPQREAAARKSYMDFQNRPRPTSGNNQGGQPTGSSTGSPSPLISRGYRPQGGQPQQPPAPPASQPRGGYEAYAPQGAPVIGNAPNGRPVTGAYGRAQPSGSPHTRNNLPGLPTAVTYDTRPAPQGSTNWWDRPENALAILTTQPQSAAQPIQPPSQGTQYRPTNTQFTDAWNEAMGGFEGTPGMTVTPAYTFGGEGEGNMAYAPPESRPNPFNTSIRGFDGQQMQPDKFFNQRDNLIQRLNEESGRRAAQAGVYYDNEIPQFYQPNRDFIPAPHQPAPQKPTPYRRPVYPSAAQEPPKDGEWQHKAGYGDGGMVRLPKRRK